MGILSTAKLGSNTHLGTIECSLRQRKGLPKFFSSEDLTLRKRKIAWLLPLEREQLERICGSSPTNMHSQTQEFTAEFKELFSSPQKHIHPSGVASKGEAKTI